MDFFKISIEAKIIDQTTDELLVLIELYESAFTISPSGAGVARQIM